MIKIKFKRHWLVGGLTILLFLALLVIRLDLFRHSGYSNSNMATLRTDTAAPQESWMNIFQGQNKIGYSHRKLSETELGYRLHESVFMRLNTIGVTQGILINTDCDLNPDMSFSSFRFQLQSSLFQFSAQGVIRNNFLVINYGLPGKESKVEMPLREKPYLAGSILGAVWGSGLKPGQSRTFHVFDPASMSQRPVVVSMHGEENISITGSQQKAKKISIDFMGARQYAWLDQKGEVLREEGLLGIRMDKATKEQAQSGILSQSGADLTEMVSLASPVIIADPHAKLIISAKLSGIDCGKFFLSGGRQTCRNGTITIQKESLPPRDIADMVIPAADREFLKATPFIQANDFLIRQKVKELLYPRDSSLTKANKIISWVYKTIEKRPVLSVPNALETLINRIGDCNEHAVLVAALARAAGIPAQVEAGLVYQKGKFYYHAWNVLYLGKWITADAVMNQLPADVTHIRFVRGEAEQQLDLIGIIGNIKLETLETK